MKIGIFCPGANGDLMYSMSILKYRHELWNNAEFVWFTEERFFNLFEHNNVETRIWGDFDQLMTTDLLLDQTKKHFFESTSDIDIGFFVYPSWMPIEKRSALNHLSEC
jgi:ADP-heptose:LPS heptosyltransferase